MPPRNIFVHRSTAGRPGATRRGAASKISRVFPRWCLPAPSVHIRVKLSSTSNICSRSTLEATWCIGCRFSKRLTRLSHTMLRRGFVLRAIRAKFDTGHVEHRHSSLLKAPERVPEPSWGLPSSTNKDLCTRPGCKSIPLGRKAVFLSSSFRWLVLEATRERKYVSMYHVRQEICRRLFLSFKIRITSVFRNEYCTAVD